jgi:hypothetical protein
MKILKKEWFIWKFEKRGDRREKGGGGNEIHAPSACGWYEQFAPVINFETKQHESEKDKFKTTRTISRATYKHSMKYYLIFIVGFHILVVMNKILMWYFVNFRCQWNVISKCSPTGRTTPRRKEVSLLDSPIIMTMRWYERQPSKNSSTNDKHKYWRKYAKSMDMQQ